VEQITVQELALQEGKKADGSPWSRYKIKDNQGRSMSIFDDGKFGTKIKVGAHLRVNIEEKAWDAPDGTPRTVRNITSYEFVENGDAPAPQQAAAYTTQKPEGGADWDKQALGKTRCALWMHFLESQLAAMLYHDGKNLEGREAIEFLITQGKRLIVAAERDIFERPPGDDGVPI
jgi:hypothetical protein